MDKRGDHRHCERPPQASLPSNVTDRQAFAKQSPATCLKIVYLVWMTVALFFYAKLYIVPKFYGVLGKFGSEM